MKSIAQRFWAKVDKRGANECWPWKASKWATGYGRLSGPGKIAKNLAAHRISWELENSRSIPTGMLIRHKCDNPICCNPFHLEIGTPSQNMADMVSRNPHKNNNGRKLDMGTVIKIKQHIHRGLPLGAIAREFCVSPKTISAIKVGTTWKHVSHASALQSGDK